MTRTWTSEQQLGNNSATNATKYNAFHNEIRNSLIAAGWVQTSDTGQADFSAGAAAVNTSELATTQYQMFRMGDSLHSTAPAYVRISFAEAGVNNYCPAYSIQLGKATDGAGNFVGDSTPVIPMRAGQNASTPCPFGNTVCTHYFSGTSNKAVFVFNGLITATGADTGMTTGFSIERSRNSSGVETGDFICLHVFQGVYPRKNVATLHYTAGAVPTETFWGSLVPFTSATGIFGTNGGVFPVFAQIGKAGNPLINIAVCKRSDFAYGANVSMTVYGAAKTYKFFKTTTSPFTNTVSPTESFLVSGTGGDTAVLILWE